MKQQITSAKTSLHQIPAIYTHYNFEPNKIIFDVGCGKYFYDIKNYIKYNYNCVGIGYDPYNQTESENQISLKELNKKGKSDYIVCANVLNVIKEDDNLYNLLKFIYDLSSDNTKILFSIYQGDQSGTGRITKNDCWQRNEKCMEYLKFIKKFFKVLNMKRNMIEVKKC